jgi:hypothetical protein
MASVVLEVCDASCVHAVEELEEEREEWGGEARRGGGAVRVIRVAVAGMGVQICTLHLEGGTAAVSVS